MMNPGNLDWLKTLILRMQQRGGAISPRSPFLTGQQPNEVALLREKLAREASGAAPSGVAPPFSPTASGVDAATAGAGPPRAPDMGLRLRGPEGGPLAQVSRVIQALQRRPAPPLPSVASVGQRGIEAMLPAALPSVASVGQRGVEAMPPALETDAGPSINEPQIPEPAAPVGEPTGDAATWESALQNPDLLMQAAGGGMTSADLLRLLLERRNRGPVDIGGPQ